MSNLKFYNHVVSINDTVKAAEELMEEAKQVSNRDQHAAWWDKKCELLGMINDALETGYWTGDLYNTLWSAKHVIGKAEVVAGLNY